MNQSLPNPMKSEIIQKITLSAQVAQSIRARILSGEYKSGEKLPQEQIASEFGTSRIPVREALHQLHSEGFIKLVSHKGAIVSEVSLEQIHELYELRARIETWLITVAIPLMTNDHHMLARQKLDEMHDDNSALSWNERNWGFHAALYSAAGRPATIAFLHKIHMQIEPYTRMIMLIDASPEHGNREHEEVFQLCLQRDVPRAAHQLDSHIIQSSARLITGLKAMRDKGTSVPLSTAIKRKL